ncbi:hypothetical protein [Salinivibrio sp. SS2]|uniref:hypothetical protein n=1 Tax=Salinivibrio sp. SS2 TaxID=1892894 RepID=UPI00084CAF29|nr:hypothetical protein [Salinivibrio sp. DV]ODQ00633.1 hypothetical protein BGK46_06175 [Salinivibrio sp. DV]
MDSFLNNIANATLADCLERRVSEFISANPSETYSSLRQIAFQDIFVETELQFVKKHFTENVPIDFPLTQRDMKYRIQKELSRQFEQKMLKQK